MLQLNLYLKRLSSKCEADYFEDIYAMYSSVPNNDLRKILAIFHTDLNKWITVIKNAISIEYDENGNIFYKGGYLHAQDSRDYLCLIENIYTLRDKLKSSEYEFIICNDKYDDFIRRTERFIVKSGGSTIPEDFAPIEAEELNPIFKIVSNIAVNHKGKTIYINM